MNKLFVFVLLSTITYLASSSALLANPSTKDPEALLRIRAAEKVAGDYLVTDYDAISKRYRQAQADNDELWKKYEAQKLTIGDARQVGPLVLLQAALRREAEFLKLRGEASGWDLSLRVAELDSRLLKMVRAMLKLPGINLNALLEQVKKANAAGTKRLPQIQALIQKQQFCQAEGETYEIIDDMMRNAIWFPDTDLSGLFNPFNAPLTSAAEVRRAKALAELQAIVDQGPDFAKLRGELAQAAAAIGSTGQATWEGQSLAGPELLTAWHTGWPKLQAAAQRTVMAQWTLEQIGSTTNEKHQALIMSQSQFASGLSAALAAIVQADAMRTSGPEAAALYNRYVSAAAVLCAVGPRQNLQTALDPALTALAAKGGLDKDVEAYRAATSPVLAWKRFFARAKAKSLAATQTPVHDWCSKVFGPPHQLETIMPEPGSNISRAKIASTPNRVLPAVLPAGPPALIVVNDVVPVSAAGGRWVARFQRRVFALVAPPPPAAWKAAVDQLEQQLLVSPQSSPLSLDAATTLTGARLGVFEAVGGPVELVTLEPLLTRFVTLPAEAGTLLPLGALPSEPNVNTGESQQSMFLSVRCDILQPQWLQHECFVLRP